MRNVGSKIIVPILILQPLLKSKSDDSSCHSSGFFFKLSNLWLVVFPSKLIHRVLEIFLFLAGLPISGGNFSRGRSSLQSNGNVSFFPEYFVLLVFRSVCGSWPEERFVLCVICFSPPVFLLIIIRLLSTIIMSTF